MRPLLTSMIAMLFAGAACAPNDGPIYISNFKPVDETCSADKAFGFDGLSAGFLDVAPGAPTFFVAVSLAGADKLDSQALLVGGHTMEPANRDKPIMNEIVLSYSSSPKLAGLKAYSSPCNITLYDSKGGLNSSTSFPTNLLSPGVSSIIESISPGDRIDLRVTVEVRGYMSGSGSRISTGPQVFPIAVVRSTNLCGPGEHYQRSLGGCLYSGQSASLTKAMCCKPSPANPNGDCVP